jgi:type II secretory pathway component PulM
MTGSDRLAPLKAAWAERTVREQGLLAGLGALLLAVIVWYGLLAPTLSWRSEARADHEAAMARYETMLTGLARYGAEVQSAAQPRAGAALRTVVGTSAAQRELAISRVQPLEDGRLGVWMEGVSDDALLAWLVALSRDEGVRVDQISLDREGDRLVRAQMVLTRGGGG